MIGSSRPGRRWIRSTGFGAVALMAALAACGGDGDGGSGPGGGGSTSFFGIVSGSDGVTSGSITISLATASPAPPGAANLMGVVSATGTMDLGGGNIDLTGTYDDESGILALTGGGYDFGGGFDGNDRLEGFYSGPNSTSGTFVTSRGSSSNADAFCGTYDASDQSDSGTFSFVLRGTTLSGTAVSSDDGSIIPLDGTVNNNQITIFIPGTQATLASGTRSGNTVSGTFDDQQGTTGTWGGSVCQ